MQEFCQSCAAPLTGDFKGPAENYCKHCTDEKGNLHPREAILGGIAQWFQSWQPGITPEQARGRAEHYMKSMPAWADK